MRPRQVQPGFGAIASGAGAEGSAVTVSALDDHRGHRNLPFEAASAACNQKTQRAS